MKTLFKTSLYVALIHYPVVNKNGDVITSAVTNLDLHDISRASKTYGVESFYVVTPLDDQKALTEKIISHWITGVGSRYNPIRRDALELIKLKDSLAVVKEDIQNKGEGTPKIVVTCARNHPRNIGYHQFREKLRDEGPFVLCFGTAWGLSNDFIDSADYILDPIWGNTDYNHLSVRSAVAIILDRLIRD